MTTEQQRKMLKCAAKACEVPHEPHFDKNHGLWLGSLDLWWNPLTNPADCAEMCAKLDIGVTYQSALGFLVCRKSIDVAAVAHYKDHDNSRLKAWMYAATMCAAKTQGYEP